MAQKFKGNLTQKTDMYIDSSRLADLAELKAEMENPKLPYATRQYAFKAFEKIIKQLKDPKLARMRERLTKANDAKDRYEVWKIRNQIKEYLKEPPNDARSY